MFSHLFGVIGCAICLGITSVSAYEHGINDLVTLDNTSAVNVGSLHDYVGVNYTYDSNHDSLEVRIYYTYDINTQEFTFDESLSRMYTNGSGLYSYGLSQPSSYTDYDTITSNYIKINSYVSSTGGSNDYEICFHYVIYNNYVYRILKYGKGLANLGYLEYYANSGTNFSLITNYVGLIGAKAIDYSSFYNVGSSTSPMFSYFDRQAVGNLSKIFYYNSYSNISLSSGENVFRVDLDLFALPDTYAMGYRSGFSSGYSYGEYFGYTEGYNIGKSDGYEIGYSSAQPLEVNFLGLIGAIADTPVLIIRNLYSFDLFGISALTIFMSLLTILIVIKVVRKYI